MERLSRVVWGNWESKPRVEIKSSICIHVNFEYLLVGNLRVGLEWAAGYMILEFRGVIQAGHRHLRAISVFYRHWLPSLASNDWSLSYLSSAGRISIALSPGECGLFSKHFFPSSLHFVASTNLIDLELDQITRHHQQVWAEEEDQVWWRQAQTECAQQPREGHFRVSPGSQRK